MKFNLTFYFLRILEKTISEMVFENGIDVFFFD